jgi:hypothetical protein
MHGKSRNRTVVFTSQQIEFFANNAVIVRNVVESGKVKQNTTLHSRHQEEIKYQG